MTTVDINAEREKIKREIEVLEKSLRPGGANVEITVSDTDADISGEGTEDEESDEQLQSRMEVEEGEDEDEEGQELSFTDDPETCLQMNMVYQEVIQEKLHEVINLLAQNKEQQDELIWELAGQRYSKPQKDKNYQANVYVGHFLKPYFKDKATGLGPPANEETRDKVAQGIKSFEELVVIKWKAREKVKLRQALVSNSLQRLLQPKLLRLGHLHQKLSKCSEETEAQLLEKQIHELEKEVEEINHLPADDLLGERFDEHDWDKIANIDFEGARTPKEIQKLWQQFEHPSINKSAWSEEETEQLKDIAAEHNFVNWEAIALQLGTNRTAFMCLQKFQAFNRELRRKEWTREEDKILKELVETMRIGRHIPYRRIAYYMEGRDSAQILTRWTQSLDPAIKKGPWSPKEDEMLLKAVAKYGVGDWYKIRKEVPGRSDAQCRERYLRGLDESLKKGKWSEEEEKMLLQSIEKYGVGHWSRIASELPHRTGSQCLSKWKIMIGLKRKTGTRKKAKSRRFLKRQTDSESSSTLSSSESEESEMTFSSSSEEKEVEEEKEEVEEVEEELSPKKKLRGSSVYTIPHIDLWIPTEEVIVFQKTSMTYFGASNRCLSERYSEENIRLSVQKKLNQFKAMSSSVNSATFRTFPLEVNTVLRGVGYPASSDIYTSDPTKLLWEAYRSGKYVIKLSMSEVKRIIKCNTVNRLSKLREQTKKFQASGSTLPSEIRPAESLESEEQVQEKSKQKYWMKMRKNLFSPCASEEFLNRKLMLAVAPWVGNVFLPCTVLGRRNSTEADNVRKQIESIGLTSTPVFTLLIQFFQIDTDGCMKIIQERKTSQLEAARGVTAPLQVICSSSGVGPLYPQSIIAAEQCTGQNRNMKDSMPDLGSENVNVFTSLTVPTPLIQPQPPRYGQKPKPKTVSELLKEKRMREARAKEQKEQLKRAIYLAPGVVVGRPVIVQHPVRHSTLSAQGLPTQQSQVPSRVPSAAVPSNVSVTVSSSGAVTVPRRSSLGTEGIPVSGTATGSTSELLKHGNISASSTNQNEEQNITSRASVIMPAQSDNLVSLSMRYQLSKDHPLMFSSQNLAPSGSNTCKNQGTDAPLPALSSSSHPVQQTETQPKTLPAVVYQGVPRLAADQILPVKWVVMPQCVTALPVQTVGLKNQNIVQQSCTASPSTRAHEPQSLNSAVTLPVAQTLPQPLVSIANNITTAVAGNASCSKESRPLKKSDSVISCVSSSVKTTVLPSTVSTDSTTGASDNSSVVGLSNKSEKMLSESSEKGAFPELLKKDSSVSVQGINPGISVYPAKQSNIIYLTSPNTTSVAPSAQNATHLGHRGQQVIQMTIPGKVVSLAKQICQPVPEPSNEPAASSNSGHNVIGQPKPSAAAPDKGLLDLSLLFLEEPSVIKEWLKGKEGVQLPTLVNSMPYLPPSVCSLKILARLLQQKKMLEQNFSELSFFKMNMDRSSDKPTDLVRALVQQKLKDNPAYLLLKQRFLSAFTLPAYLAIFPPSRVNTTVSKSSDKSVSLEDTEEEDYDEDEILQTYRRLSLSKYGSERADEHLQNGDLMATANSNASEEEQLQPVDYFPEFTKETQESTDTDIASGHNASSLTTGFIKARSMRLRKRIRKF